MSNKQNILLGLLALVAIGVLGFYTLFLTDVNLFSKPVQMIVHFESANGLRKGDAVQVAGLRVGRVKSLTFDARAEPTKRITVLLNLDEDIPLFENYSILIEETTLLGGRNISIRPGLSSLPQLAVAPGMILSGHLAPNMTDSLSSFASLLDDNRSSISSIFSNASDITDDLRAGRGVFGRLLTDDAMSATLDSAVSEFEAAGSDLREIAGRVNRGEGTLGKLFTSDEMYNGLKATIGDLNTIADRISAGEGVVGKLLNDDALGGEIERALNNIAAISDDLRNGRGTIGQLLTDSTTADNAEAISGDLREVVAKIVAGEGSIGALWASDELYQNLVSFSGRIDRLTSDIQAGEGTISKLLLDDELYQELLTGAKLLNRSLEDYREAAPVSAFSTALFNVF